jgi:uncharacterized protein
MTSKVRAPGEFCWINMITPRPAEARAFFARVLGWTYFEMPGMGHGVEVGGRQVGGLFDLDGPNTPSGAAAHIGVMIKVEKAEATCARIVSLGGSAQAPFDIAERLRMAVCADPCGAGFDLWEPKTSLGTDVDSMLHGAPSWFETLTTDLERARRFYSDVFGWTPELKPTPGFDYTTFKYRGAYVAGAFQITPAMGPMPSHWATYFTVKDANEAARLSVELGATICMAMKEVPGVGRFCGITSPQGVTFYVMQYMN